MNRVEPIREVSDIEKIKHNLFKKSTRNYLLFIIGINTGIKTCQLLQLKFKDILNENMIVDYISIDSKKYYINQLVKDCIDRYIRETNIVINKDDYIFASRKNKKPINRSHAYRIISESAQDVDIKYGIGIETMRKTFGYHFYMQSKDIIYLQKLFDHPNTKVTFDYIGIRENRNSIQNHAKFSL